MINHGPDKANGDGPEPPDFRRLLAVSTTAVGDTLLSTPALRLLRRSFPEAELDLLVHGRCQDLLALNPNFDRLFTFRNNSLARGWLAMRLGRVPYDRVLIFHANESIKKLLKKLTYAEALNVQDWDDEALLLRSIPVGYEIHTIVRRQVMVGSLGGPGIDAGVHMDLVLGAADLRRAEDFLVQSGLENEKFACLHPGAADPYKCWPAERFGVVAAHLRDQYALRVVVTGVAVETAIFESVKQAAGEGGGRNSDLVWAADLPLRTLAAVLKRAEILVTNDTGPLHLALTQGTPSVSLFVPTDAATIGPFQAGSDHVALQKSRPCEPCDTKRCRRLDCMDLISVDEVIAEIDRLPAGKGGAA
ncbi:MAG: glycosyltransferase family 9 protein [Proteobacteria bacterium]|nr:glycosyltransferase family 9 protein [Pseudomonadota bacterium]MBU1740989.1 glycosyltransferase family 9 protein [Pseudomonadota bacterium]